MGEIQQLTVFPVKTRARSYYWNRERLMCYIIMVSIVIGYALFLYNDAALISKKYTVLAPALITLALVSTIFHMLKAAFCNPGVIPPDDAKSHEFHKRNMAMAVGHDQNQREIEVTVKVDGKLVHLKYCVTCRVIRPPRAAHCSSCDICVYRLDHHCPYLGNCIGLLNYRNFYLFLVSVVSYTGFGFTFTFLHFSSLSNELGSAKAALDASPITMVGMVAAVSGGLAPLALLMFHTYILLSGVTSRELLKGTFKTKENPYRGKNWFQSCLMTLRSKKIPNGNFELIPQEEDQVT